MFGYVILRGGEEGGGGGHKGVASRKKKKKIKIEGEKIVFFSLSLKCIFLLLFFIWKATIYNFEIFFSLVSERTDLQMIDRFRSPFKLIFESKIILFIDFLAFFFFNPFTIISYRVSKIHASFLTF